MPQQFLSYMISVPGLSEDRQIKEIQTVPKNSLQIVVSYLNPQQDDYLENYFGL